jgi:hypothetical protein
LRHLLEISNLFGQGIYPLGQTGCAERCSGNRKFKKTWLQTVIENGNKDDTQAGTVVRRNLKEGEIQDDRGNDGGTNFT